MLGKNQVASNCPVHLGQDMDKSHVDRNGSMRGAPKRPFLDRDAEPAPTRHFRRAKEKAVGELKVQRDSDFFYSDTPITKSLAQLEI